MGLTIAIEIPKLICEHETGQPGVKYLIWVQPPSFSIVELPWPMMIKTLQPLGVEFIPSMLSKRKSF